MTSAPPTDLDERALGPGQLGSRFVLGVRTDVTNYSDAATMVMGWAVAKESRYVCVANVHMVMESHDSTEFLGVVNGADLVTPDGMPLVWALRLFGAPEATRVYGPDLTTCLLERAAANGVPIGFYGGTPVVLAQLVRVCRGRFPGLQVAYTCAPPFRQLTPREDATIVHEINTSGASLLFVGLGCPKQERWMASHRGSVSAVMLGVGAAFDFISGTKPRAPEWMQRTGLEWLFRLATEPRRLWRRYVYHNPRFLALLLRQYLKRVHA